MNKYELIDALEDMPEDADICIDNGFCNYVEADSVHYDANHNIIIIE